MHQVIIIRELRPASELDVEVNNDQLLDATQLEVVEGGDVEQVPFVPGGKCTWVCTLLHGGNCIFVYFYLVATVLECVHFYMVAKGSKASNDTGQ